LREIGYGKIILQKKIKSNLGFQEYYSEIRKIEKEALVEAIRKILEIQ